MFADKEVISIYNEIALPFAFSDLSASIFINILKNHEKFETTKKKTIEVNKKIYKVLKKENYIYSNLETPIFTIKTNKYKNLSNKLAEEGLIAEDCGCFLNLDSTFARIRVTNDYEKIIEILLKNL